VVNAQHLNNESKIIDFIGQSRFNELQANNSTYLKFLDVKCQIGYEIQTIPFEKLTDKEVLTAASFKKFCDKQSDSSCNSDYTVGKSSASEILSLINEGNFNFLIYQLASDPNKDKIYVLGSTGKVLIVRSAKFLADAVNSNQN
jgi:hypothetical protein